MPFNIAFRKFKSAKSVVDPYRCTPSGRSGQPRWLSLVSKGAGRNRVMPGIAREAR